MTRDFNVEAAALPRLSFDLQMHDYMMDTFRPWFRGGAALELGCFMGDFTHHICKEFETVTVIEAASECIRISNERLANVKAEFVHSTFEAADLKEERFDAIFLIHAIEHLDDPVRVLTRCRDWLAPGGRLFLACPNANAASRQIAVAMGLLPSNQCVTGAEREHGHKRTYALDTLELDARLAGLKVMARGGIFFKAMSGAQFDNALAAKIIDNCYMEGCYQIGQRYPDLCNSVYLVCEA